jgi:hypothetical protein
VPTLSWLPFSIDFSGDLTAEEMMALEEQDVTVRFYCQHDGDRYGTWFYVDEVAFETCTTWPEPAQQADLGFISGRTWVKGSLRSDVVVWAQNHGTGDLLHTTSLGPEDVLPNGTFRFYNVEPGTYTVYSEVWEGGVLYWDAETVIVVAGGDLTVNLNLRS